MLMQQPNADTKVIVNKTKKSFRSNTVKKRQLNSLDKNKVKQSASKSVHNQVHTNKNPEQGHRKKHRDKTGT